MTDVLYLYVVTLRDGNPQIQTNSCNQHSFSYVFHVKALHTFQAQISRLFTLDMIFLHIPFRRYRISAECLLKHRSYLSFLRNRSTSVGTVTGQRVGMPRNRHCQKKKCFFPPIRNIQPSSWGHPEFYPIGIASKAVGI